MTTGKGYRVLLVDDEPDSRETLRRLLELKGYVVDTADNGVEAPEILGQSKAPSIVLLDLLMPLMTGWEFCAEVNKRAMLSSLPIVILSAMVGAPFARIPNTVAQTSKPVDIENLYGILERHCV